MRPKFRVVLVEIKRERADIREIFCKKSFEDFPLVPFLAGWNENHYPICTEFLRCLLRQKTENGFALCVIKIIFVHNKLPPL